MAYEITYLTSFVAGMASFLSPCVLPLVPPYLCYMAGASVDELVEKDAKTEGLQRRVLVNSLQFVLGFSAVFIALGASASSIGALVREYLDILSLIAGVMIIAMGLHFLGVFRIALLYREARFQTNIGTAGSSHGSNGMPAGGPFLMGLAFAFGWTPCIGPVLGTILTYAGAQDSIGQGVTMLAFYSLGLGIPFMLAAMFTGPFMRFLARFKKHLGYVEMAMGAVLVLTGILFLTGGMASFAFWMQEQFPGLANIEKLAL